MVAGDKVRILVELNKPYFSIGQIATIYRKQFGNFILVSDSGDYWWFDRNEFEPLNQVQ